MSTFAEQYKHIIKDLEKVNTDLLDCRQAEPYYLNLLRFIKKHPKEREFFVSDFINRLRKGIQPWEVIPFCMRELQWQEIRDAAIVENAKTDDWRIISVMNDIIAVYEPEWADADFYMYYSKEDTD